ncbi:MAG: glycosyltransferase family 39 protein [Phycisphaerales bacterium]|nr:glycosyltransferase family 39 protein [Phycisphaerales bacterium]
MAAGPHSLTSSPAWHRCLTPSAVTLIAAVTLARLLYICFLCPYHLIEDEAQYWVWSTRPDWSYYSKGPGIAWSIWLSVKALGLSEFGVRALAPIYSALAAFALAGLAADAARDRRAALAAAAIFFLTPLFLLNGLFLMTIDGPLLAFWSIACWAIFRAAFRASARAWLIAAAAVAVGFLFKYTLALFIPSALIALALAHPALHSRWKSLAPAALAVALLGLVPIAIWNAQHDWPAIKHLLGHAKLPGGDVAPTPTSAPFTLKYFFEFLGIQLAAVGPALGLMLAARRFTADPETNPAARFLLALGFPTLALYTLMSVFTSVEGNWAMAAFLSLTSLAAIALVRGLDDWRRKLADWRALPQPRPRAGIFLQRPETLAQISWHATLVYGVLATLLFLRLDLVAIGLEKLGKPVAMHRLLGAPDYANAIDQLRQRETRNGAAPMLFSYHYGVAAQLTFYLPDHPMVRVAGSRLGYRRTQWDLWPDLSLDNPDLTNRDAILIGAAESQWSTLFSSVESLGNLPQDRRKDRWTYLGRGYLAPSQRATNRTTSPAESP